MRARGHLTPGCKKVEVCVGGSGVLTGAAEVGGVGGGGEEVEEAPSKDFQLG